MELVSHIDYHALHAADLNDCWGYVDETGIEYALVGTTKGTSIVSLQDPANPVEVFWIAGTESPWRDLQVWEDYAYVTTEAQDGLLIIDLSPLPASSALPTATYFGPAGNGWQSAHDVFVDSEGYAYICGANRGQGGIIILDIHTDPMNPAEVGVFDNWYCHDAFAQGDLLYGAHISDGLLSIVDISDRSAPVLLNTQVTPNSFTHNVWVTTDDQYAVTTDEIPGSYLTLYDVSNPMNITEVDRIRSSPGFSIIPHNAFILGDSLICSSYYTDGITIHSMSRPHNLVGIASYDTHPLHDGTFNGSWGIYPFLPSGLMLASDISEGLFVIQPTIVTPCYYEGLVRDAGSLSPVQGVSVEISGDQQSDATPSSGDFAVGTAEPGMRSVTFSKIAYYPQTVSVDFQSGVVQTDTIDLVPIPPFWVDVTVVEEGTGNPVIGANISFRHPEQELFGVTNGIGEEEMTLYYPGETWVTVGKWGHTTHCATYNVDETTGSLTITLQKGYYDDFKFDNDWIAYGNAQAGMWERGIPSHAIENPSPPSDADFDCGDEAFVTGNGTLEFLQYDFVTNGTTTLLSPLMNLTGYSDPYVHYDRWYKCDGGPFPPNDTLRVYLLNGIQTQLIDFVPPQSDTYMTWVPTAIRVLDFMQLTPNMQIKVVISEQAETPNVTEVAFDRFFVANESHLSVEEKASAQLRLFPNPVREKLSIEGDLSGSAYVILTADGRLAAQGTITGATIDCSALRPGMYFLGTNGSTARFVKE
jgi:choice-of-anchor B domain-containing protein